MDWNLVLNFISVVSVQLIVFFGFVYYYQTKDWRNYLFKGAIIGLLFGLPFDLYVGHTVGMFTYEFGFILPFLIINGLLSYGTMFANIYIFKGHSAVSLFIPLILVGAVYEAANFLFPVWNWTFAPHVWQEYLYAIFIGYTGLGIIMIGFLSIFTKEKFNLAK